jgi:DNA-binding HxlR family transcriptional regulator
VRCRRCNPVPEEVRRTAGLLERRWTLSILYASIEGAVRFNEFRDSVGRVPPATLTVRLSVLDTRPPAVEYRMTSHGRRFEPVLRELVRCSRL